MAVEGASSVLAPAMTLHAGGSISSFRALPFVPPGPGPAHRPCWEQPPMPVLTAAFPQGSPLLLSAVPGTSLVAGDGGRGPSGAVPFNTIVQVGTQGRPAEPPHSQNIVLAPGPLPWGAPVVVGGGAEHPAPLLLAAPAMKTLVTAPAGAGPQPHEGSWLLGPPPLAPPALAQLAPIVSPVNAGPRPHGACGQGGQAPPEDFCQPESVYENFRRWQRFKTLVRRHLPQSPDVEALSCFLIPVLRSLARLKPTMTLEEGLWRGVQEWQRTSNFDRMIFHEMAGKFSEFEVAEEMENAKLWSAWGFQCRPPPAPPRLEPPSLPAPEVAQHPGCNPKKPGPKARPARRTAPRRQRPPESQTPREIPPEAVREYMDIMDWLLGPPHSAIGAPGGHWEEAGVEQQQQQRDHELYRDPGLLSYIDKLCSLEGFVTKVEAIIHPRFMAELLSPEPDMDIAALTEELEQEEGLTPEQMVEKRLRALSLKGGVGAPPSASASTASPGAESGAPSPGRAGSAEARPPPTASGEQQRRGAPDAALPGPKGSAVLPGRHGSPSPGAPEPTAAPRGHGIHSLSLGPRGTGGLRGASPPGGPRAPADYSSDDDEDLPSLAFLLASQHRLLPWGLSQSPGPDAVLLCPGGRAPAPSPPHRRGLSPGSPAAAKCTKRALLGAWGPVEKMSRLGPRPGVAEGQDLALGLLRPSQPQKRRCESLGTRKRKKRP